MGEETREKIVNAAILVFARNGFFRSSIEQVAKEAGVSKGLVFWYFRSKDDLVLEVAYRSLPLDVINTCLSSGLKGPSLLKCIGKKYLEKYSNPTYKNLLLQSLAAEAIYPQIREKVKNLCQETLRRVAKEVYGEDSTRYVVAIRTFLGSLLCFTLRKPSDIGGEEYLDALIDILVKGA